jgi:hypothetical protein
VDQALSLGIFHHHKIVTKSRADDAN